MFTSHCFLLFLLVYEVGLGGGVGGGGGMVEGGAGQDVFMRACVFFFFKGEHSM